jgi:hypothetical protein
LRDVNVRRTNRGAQFGPLPAKLRVRILVDFLNERERGQKLGAGCGKRLAKGVTVDVEGGTNT